MPEAGPAHLSIGEVLGLLLEEFPDVTISKIRFLESQGLIEPERTPSGYRKFFDDDVELLRVILREQREKFLPLRVIKDRIDSGEIETRRPDAAAGDAEQPTPAHVAEHPPPGAPAADAAEPRPPSPATRRPAAPPRAPRPRAAPTRDAGAAGRPPAARRARQPRRAVRDGVGDARPAGPARGLRRRRRSAAPATSTARTPSRSPPPPAGSCGPASTPATCGRGGRRSSGRPGSTSS